VADPYQALYRRYRSKRFSEQRGQDHVMRALRTAVQEDRVGHAYLFSGPRGTGKTSTARILAKVLNCENPADGEPCGTCENCVAVDEGRIVDWLLELDAASNNGVANIRDLIERIPLGTSGNRKVVILDEVHMLIPGASNALLKSLEEPPAHVVFILATTDPQKVLPTIRSRTQHFEFHLLPAEELADHVRHVIADAGLDLGEDAVEHVVRQGGGSARDTLSALDQVSAMGGVVQEGQPLEAILDALHERDAGAALVAVAEATSAGRDPRVLGELLMGRLRDAFLAVMGAPDRHLPESDVARAAALGEALGAPGLTRALEVLGEALVELAKKPDPRIVLEVALVRICRPDADRSLDAVLDRLERLEKAVAAGPVATPSATPAAAPATTTAAPAVSSPAADARAELAKVRSASTGPAGPPPGRAREPVKKAVAPRAPAAPAPRAEPGGDPSTPADPPAASPPSAHPEPAPPPASRGGLPSPEELEAAWPAVLGGLKPGTKAVFLTGRFAPAAGGAVVYALANGPTRDHCEKKRPEVEAALAAHFGRPVPLRLVTDAEVGGAPPSAAAPAAPAAAVDDHVDDVHALEDAPTAATGVERLAEAFPGAELVEEP
jgi:DNA polymerase-3 subunit gamma/tau